MKQAKVTALVPMKEHSERVPSKNIRDFCGRPLFCRIIDALLQAKNVGKIYVDTDGPRIKALIQEMYANVGIVDRPAEIRGDLIPMNRVIAHDLSVIEGEHFLQTHSTNPLLTPETIDRAIEEYFKRSAEGYDSLFGVTEFYARFYNADYAPVNHRRGELLRTQDLPPLFMENSCLYVFSRNSFGSSSADRIGRKPYLFRVNKKEAVDIDDEEDYLMAELLYAALNEKDG